MIGSCFLVQNHFWIEIDLFWPKQGTFNYKAQPCHINLNIIFMYHLQSQFRFNFSLFSYYVLPQSLECVIMQLHSWPCAIVRSSSLVQVTPRQILVHTYFTFIVFRLLVHMHKTKYQPSFLNWHGTVDQNMQHSLYF